MSFRSAFSFQYGADFSVKSPRVYAERLLNFIKKRTEGYDLSVISPSLKTFDEPKEANPLPSARHSTLKCSYSFENLFRASRPKLVSLQRSQSLSSLMQLKANSASVQYPTRKVRRWVRKIWELVFFIHVCSPTFSHWTSKYLMIFQTNFHLSSVYLTRWRCHTVPFNAKRQAGKLWIPILYSLVWPDRESNSTLYSDLFHLRFNCRHQKKGGHCFFFYCPTFREGCGEAAVLVETL